MRTVRQLCLHAGVLLSTVEGTPSSGQSINSATIGMHSSTIITSLSSLVSLGVRAQAAIHSNINRHGVCRYGGVLGMEETGKSSLADRLLESLLRFAFQTSVYLCHSEGSQQIYPLVDRRIVTFVSQVYVNLMSLMSSALQDRQVQLDQQNVMSVMSVDRYIGVLLSHLHTFILTCLSSTKWWESLHNYWQSSEYVATNGPFSMHIWDCVQVLEERYVSYCSTALAGVSHPGDGLVGHQSRNSATVVINHLLDVYNVLIPTLYEEQETLTGMKQQSDVVTRLLSGVFTWSYQSKLCISSSMRCLHTIVEVSNQGGAKGGARADQAVLLCFIHGMFQCMSSVITYPLEPLYYSEEEMYSILHVVDAVVMYCPGVFAVSNSQPQGSESGQCRSWLPVLCSLCLKGYTADVAVVRTVLHILSSLFSCERIDVDGSASVRQDNIDVTELLLSTMLLPIATPDGSTFDPIVEQIISLVDNANGSTQQIPSILYPAICELMFVIIGSCCCENVLSAGLRMQSKHQCEMWFQTVFQNPRRLSRLTIENRPPVLAAAWHIVTVSGNRRMFKALFIDLIKVCNLEATEDCLLSYFL